MNKSIRWPQEKRWVLFSNGCMHGIRRSDLVIVRSKPNRSVVRSSVSVVTVSSFCTLLAGLGLLALLVLVLAGCAMPGGQRGGQASTTITRPGHTNSAKVLQSENPKEPSRQKLQSEQTIEYVLPRGSAVPLGTRMVSGDRRAAPGDPRVQPGGPEGAASEGFQNDAAILSQAMPVRVVTKDQTETTLGAAQKDNLREWAGKAARMRPVMWAGIVMMTLVAGVLIYFGWWTKAAVAAAVGIGMIVLAQTLPDHGGTILLGGLGVFALAALLVLYAYYKGQLDRNQNGVPDFLEREKGIPF